uniref:putative universal stress protein SAUSA300_1656 n=1 Tax=Styela clava TaxID=7725 RepID=UPI001939E2A1|nr:putative universal stress protein SAUSA300_1656 [Styela clava]
MADSVGETTSGGSRVLICVDGSHNAELAFNYYADHFHKPSNEIVLLHVADLVIPHSHLYYGMGVAMPTGSTESMLQSALEQERKKLKEIETKYRTKCKDAGMKHDFITKMKDNHGVGATIVEAAIKNNMTFVVVGTRGLGSIRRTILGSVSDYVLHHSHIPMLICPKHEEK